MRLLSVIFPSNHPNYGSDSIYVFNRIMLSSLVELDPTIEVALAGAPDMPAFHPVIPVHAFHTGSDKFQVRLGMRWPELADIIRTVRPDVILVNMPEQAGALAALVRNVLKLDCLIASYVHYIPAVTRRTENGTEFEYEGSMDGAGSGRLMIMRLLEGLAASDVAMICSDFGAQTLRDLAATHLGAAVRLPEIAVIPPPVDEAESAAALQAGLGAVPRFVYNHRLYDEYGTRLIFDLFERAWAANAGAFEVVVTDPTSGRDAERRRLNAAVDENLERLRGKPYVRVKHFTDRAEYFREIGSCTAGIAPYKPNALWSMSVFDVLAAGRAVVAFDMAAFPAMGLPSGDLVATGDAFLERLEKLIAVPPEEVGRSAYRAIAVENSGRRTAERFLRAFQGPRSGGD